MREKRSTFGEHLCSLFVEGFYEVEICQSASERLAEYKEIPALEGREGARGFLVCLLWRRKDCRARKAVSPITNA